jgi:hypothetical protein
MKHCCDVMQHQVDYRCDQHHDPFDCPDNLIHYSDKFDEYGIIIHSGGSSYRSISFCPWCGSRLPGSKRDRWFEELEALGFDDPLQQDIPLKYESGEWHRG